MERSEYTSNYTTGISAKNVQIIPGQKFLFEVKFLSDCTTVSPTDHFQFKIVGCIRKAPDGGTMCATWPRVVNGYKCLKLGSQLMKKDILIKGKLNQMFV
jgi:hypothetical protein